MDVNKELKLLLKLKKKKLGMGSGGPVHWGGRMGVNQELKLL